MNTFIPRNEGERKLFEAWQARGGRALTFKEAYREVSQKRLGSAEGEGERVARLLAALPEPEREQLLAAAVAAVAVAAKTARTSPTGVEREQPERQQITPAQKQREALRDYLLRGEWKTPDASEDSPELTKERATLATKLAAADPRMQFGFWLRKGTAVVDESGTPAWASKEAQALRDRQQRQQIEHKSVPLAALAQSSAGADSGMVKLSGYAATYDTDLGNDRIARGAFAGTLKSLEDRRTRLGTPYLLPLFAGHNTDKPIGGVTAATELPGGLYIEAAIDVDTAEGFAVVSGASKEYNRGMSIGYYAQRSHFESSGTRVLDAVQLFEISLTPIPMNAEARIDSLS